MLRPGIGVDPQHHSFALGISKNANICVTPNAKHKLCVTLNAKPQHQPMEYRFSHWPCKFHVVCAHFIFVGYPTRTSLQWNMGFIYFESPQNNFMGLRNVIDMRFPDMKDCWYLTQSYQLRKCLQTDLYMTVLTHM